MASVEENESQHLVECDLCQRPVSFFCKRCKVNLCDLCLPVHVRFKSKNGHGIVDYVDKDDNDTCFCDFHPKNECSAFCKTCDTPICMLCVSIKHKSHEMSELSGKIDELLKVIAEDNEQLQALKHDLDEILDHTTTVLSSISSIYKQKKDEVTKRGEEWQQLIEKTVNKLHQELDDMQKEHELLLQKQKTELKEMIDNMNKINRKAKRLQKSHDVKEMQTFIPLIEKQEILTEFTQYSFPTFNKCKMDANFMHDYFGYVGKIQEMKISLAEKKFQVNEFSQRKILEVPTVISIIDTGFLADEEYKNRLCDMAVTDDNKVWMGGNCAEQLKLFDLQGNLSNTVNISNLGNYFCMYNKLVVYSDSSNSVVKMISDTNTVVTMFTTGDWKPHGITSTASGDLLVCLCRDEQFKVVRFSSTGTVLQEIQYDSKCQPLFKYVAYITENINGDIIVTDWEEKSTIAVDRLGIFRYSYKGNESNFLACSVANDSFGYVYVTDFNGDKIHMLDRDGRFLRYIIPEGGINAPRAVCFLLNGEMMVGECLTGIAKRIKYLEE